MLTSQQSYPQSVKMSGDGAKRRSLSPLFTLLALSEHATT
jgi:hypothetical protein